jgi:hypothetical protein
MDSSGYYTSGNFVIYMDHLVLVRYFWWAWYVARMGRRRMPLERTRRWMIILIVILLNLLVGWEFGATVSGLHPLALFVSRVEPSGSTIVRVYSFLLDHLCIGVVGWARTQSTPPL